MFVGHEAGDAGTTVTNNVYVGYGAGTSDTQSTQTTIVGAQAGTLFNPGSAISYTTIIGFQAGYYNATGLGNTYVGYHAGFGVSGNNNSGNTVVGALAFDAVTTGNNNTVLGNGAGSNMTTGGQNVIIGHNTAGDLTTGANNVIIGRESEVAASGDNNCIVLGESVTCTGSGNFTFGFSTVDSNIVAGATTITAPSDERYKENIADSTAGLSFINDLRPVTFQWKKEKDVPSDHRSYVEGSDKRVMNSDGETNHGFIAQEVKTVIDNHPELKDGFNMWSEDPTDGRQRLGDGALIPMLVKAIQELSAEVEKLKSGG